MNRTSPYFETLREKVYSMRDPNKKPDCATREVAHSSAAEDARSNVFPMYPGWPPAELPEHVYGLRHVGQPHSSAHDSEAER